MQNILDELLDRWEESSEKGHELTPEQLCAEHPELLEELRWRINALRAVDAQFGASANNNGEYAANSSKTDKLNQTVQVESQFRIDRLHASGGLGDVYLATDPMLRRTVAVKYPRSHRLNAEQLARFEREAQITGRLNHPGVVPVHALKRDGDNQPCYVMRFVDGPTLQDRIEQLFNEPNSNSADFYSSLSIRQLLQSFIALCNIVAYAHDNGIVHRDIKPANVILGPFGETMLMDWGLAKVIGDPESGTSSFAASELTDTVADYNVQTRAGQFMGTPAYASPEQLQGRVDLLDSRSDVYSLGATLMALLTGSPPKRNARVADDDTSKSNGSSRATNSRGQNEKNGVVDLRGLRNRSGGQVPWRLIAILQKALEEDFDQRYESVVNLREDIERFLAGEPISVVQETPWSRLSRTIRRRSGWVAALLVGVSVAVAAGGLGSVVLGQKNQQLQSANEQLTSANSKSLASQQRAAATTELLKRAMRASTPEVAQGKEPTVRQLLDSTSQRLIDDPTVPPLVAADTHQLLSDAYLGLGVFETAQKHAGLASQLHYEHSGPESSDALHSQAAHAVLLARTGKEEDAMRIALDALERGRKAKDLDKETLAILFSNYATVWSLSKSPKFDEILILSREAYEVAKMGLGADHATTLRMCSDLAVALMDAEKLNDAEPLLVEIRQIHEAKLGKKHPETLVDAFNHIALLYNKKDFQAGLDLAKTQWPIFEEVEGLNHPRTIRLKTLIGMLEFEMGNFAEAELHYRMGLELAVKALGPVHRNALEARGMLVGALVKLGKFDEAESIANEQYKLTEAEFGAKHQATVQATTLFFDLAEAKGDIDAMSKWLESLRGTPFESGAEETLRKAKEKK